VDAERPLGGDPAPAASIVLAGGAGRRLGGVDKPGLMIGGHSLLDRALTAVGDGPAVVVGPPRTTARPVRFTTEDPPGSGPAAALRAGVGALPPLPADAAVAVLAADLPAVAALTVRRLVTALTDTGPIDGAGAVDGAVLVDGAGHEQLLLGVWRHGPLLAACTARSSWAGASLRSLLAPLSRVRIPALGAEAADVDTPEQWRRWSGR
jgi:molybdopterin-guanine dinucleotide biosynthesis protein A